VSGKVLVWGAGAIGGTIGAALARAGYDVLLVDRAADHVAAINRDGLAITGPIESYTVRARATTPERVAGTFETVLLAVKGALRRPAAACRHGCHDSDRRHLPARALDRNRVLQLLDRG